MAKKKSFTFLGFKFSPVRFFTPSESKKGLGLPLNSIGISNYNKDTMPNHTTISDKWNWDDFYEAAGEMVADIYLLNGKAQVIPCTNELFAYGKEEAAKLAAVTINRPLPEKLTLLVTGTGYRERLGEDKVLLRSIDSTIHLHENSGKLAHALVNRYNAFPYVLSALKQLIHDVEHEGVVSGRVVGAVLNAKEAISIL